MGFNPTDLNDLRVSEGSSLQGSAEERVEEYSTANLTGMWKVNSEETPCYVHHVKYANEDNKVEDNSLWWIGASKEGGDMPWMVVYNGTIDNEKNEIDGKWAAIPITIANGKWAPQPKGTMHGRGLGKLRLKIISQTNERRISLVRMSERYVGENGGFGGSAWEMIGQYPDMD